MTIDLASWAWPQWTFALIYAFHLLANAVLDGKPKTGDYSLSQAMFGVAVGAGVLFAGGFWS